MNIGIIGAGAIGRFLMEKLNGERKCPSFTITAVFDNRTKSKERLQELAHQYGLTVYDDLNLFLQSDVDIVVECANVQVAKEYALQVVEKKDVLLISVGALVEQAFYEQLSLIAKSSGKKVYLPSGAIGGLDVIKSAKALGGLNAVTLVTRKPPASLSIELADEKTILFEGSAAEAIGKYPQNANVAITLSLAGIGVHDTKVKIIADPNVERNVHTIYAEGEFGTVEVTVENEPSPMNPKTSYLTALSILSSLKSIEQQVVIG